MGIKKLLDLIRKYAPGAIKVKNIKDAYMNKRIAVDLSIYIFKYKAIFGSEWIVSFINMMLMFLHYDITCVIVFDSPNVNLAKAKEHEKRASVKQKLKDKTKQLEKDITEYNKSGAISQTLLDVSTKVASSRMTDKVQQFMTFKSFFDKGKASVGVEENEEEKKFKFDIEYCKAELAKLKTQDIKIESKDIVLVKQLIQILGLKHYISKSEAEGTCSYICHANIVDAVLSEDSDVIAYGCKCFLTKINIGNESVNEIDYNRVLKDLDLDEKSFLDLCVLLGTDFNKNLKGIGVENAYKLIKKHGCIETILEETKHTKESIDGLDYVKTRQLFDIDNPCIKYEGVNEGEKNEDERNEDERNEGESRSIDIDEWKRFLFENNIEKVFGHVNMNQFKKQNKK
jgi:5'-3' exonuclease